MINFRKLACVLFPERCPYCRRVIEYNEIACPKCLKNLDKKQHPIIRGVFGFRVVSSFPYSGRVRHMILYIKYQEITQYLPQIAVIMAKDIRNQYDGIRFDYLTFVPMHWWDLDNRGFNQSEELAKELSKLLEIPYMATLKKTKRTKKQHKLKYAQRKTNLNGSIQLIDKELVKGKSILLIDDIVTSGFTLGACCKVLNRAKPEMICCATIANASFHPAENGVI